MSSFISATASFDLYNKYSSSKIISIEGHNLVIDA